jgi:bla regulator protein blaR1
MLMFGTRLPQKVFLNAVFTVAILGALSLGMLTECLQAQTLQPGPDWQKEAGGKQSFEVASVRQSLPDSHRRDNIDLGPMNSFSLPGGLFSTNVSLDNYIIFAYKIADGSQYQSLSAQLPKWAKSPAKFDVEARAAGHPTKDQLRLMMQALLQDRFKLAIHTETKQLPVYSLVLDTRGKPGPQLRAHPASLPCPEIPTAAVQGPEPPPVCGLIQTWVEGGLFHLRMMDVSMDIIAGTLVPFLGRMGRLDDRPSIDRTGLTGMYDFTIAFQPEPQPNPQESADAQPERNGPTLTEALKKQLGLRLLRQEGPVNAFVIDHVEMPSEN